MKYIQKQKEPDEFTEWKETQKNNPKLSYRSLGRSSVKKKIKQALMKEQGYLCCYCEQELTLNDSHIEHFRPRNDPTVDALDFSNMLCSCQKELKKGQPIHCGHKKDLDEGEENCFDDNNLISPLDPNCETRFEFTHRGYIKPRTEEDNAALITIEKLGLNIKILRDRRRKAIDNFLDTNLSIEDFKMFVKGYLSPSSDGKFREFWTTIDYLFGKYIDED